MRSASRSCVVTALPRYAGTQAVARHRRSNFIAHVPDASLLLPDVCMSSCACRAVQVVKGFGGSEEAAKAYHALRGCGTPAGGSHGTSDAVEPAQGPVPTPVKGLSLQPLSSLGDDIAEPSLADLQWTELAIATSTDGSVPSPTASSRDGADGPVVVTMEFLRTVLGPVMYRSPGYGEYQRASCATDWVRCVVSLGDWRGKWGWCSFVPRGKRKSRCHPAPLRMMLWFAVSSLFAPQLPTRAHPLRPRVPLSGLSPSPCCLGWPQA